MHLFKHQLTYLHVLFEDDWIQAVMKHFEPNLRSNKVRVISFISKPRMNDWSRDVDADS